MELDFVTMKIEESLNLGIELVKIDDFLVHIIESLSPSSPWSKSLKTSYCSRGGAIDTAMEQVKKITAIVNEKYANIPMALVYKDSIVKKSAEIEELAKPYLD